MNNFGLLNIVNIFKYLTTILVMGCILIVYKTIMDGSLISYLFIITMIVYFSYMIVKFVIKDKDDTDDWFKNIISILLNIYVFLIMIRKYYITNSVIYYIDENYFIANYIIVIVVSIVLMASDLLKTKKYQIK